MFTGKSLFDFFGKMLEAKNLKDFIESGQDEIEQGFMFEQCVNILVKFGYHPSYPQGYGWEHLQGNVSTGVTSVILDLVNYLKTTLVKAGKATGVSDVTIKRGQDFVFSSCKYFQKEKDVGYYDIQNIVSVTKHNKIMSYKILLFVKNKKLLKHKIKNSNESSKHIIKYMKNIYGLKDLEKWFKQFKHDFLLNPDINSYILPKCILKARFHQNMTIIKSIKLLKSGETIIVWEHKCRSGKSYCVALLIMEECKTRKTFNVMIVSNAPTETLPQFNTLFQKYLGFEKFNIHYITREKDFKNIEYGDKNIFIVSKQILQTSTDKLIKCSIDRMFFDEHHFGGSTKISKDIISLYTPTASIFISGTAEKSLVLWNIQKRCIIRWGLNDEQLCKTKNLLKIKEKYGFDVTYDEIEDYQNCPNLEFLTNLFNREKYSEIFENTKFGFSFTNLFSVDKNTKKFNYETDVVIFLQYISGSRRDIYNDNMYDRIRKIQNNKKCISHLTEIWYLPPNNINQTSKCLKILMENDPILKLSEILIINSKQNIDNVKVEISKCEKIAKSKNTKLIILCGRMLSLGITLDNCGVIFRMDDCKSRDQSIQKEYRCCSEFPGKTVGIVVVFDISNVINMIIDLCPKKSGVKQSITYAIENNLINIDSDTFNNFSITKSKQVELLFREWLSNPFNCLKRMQYELSNIKTNISIDDQKSLNLNFTHFKEKLQHNDNKEAAPTGIKKTIVSNKSKKKSDKVDINFAKDVLVYIVPFMCIIVDGTTLIEMFDNIKNSEEMIEIFNSQCDILWDKPNLFVFIHEIIKKYFIKNEILNNNISIIKEGMRSLINKPEKLLEYINDCLQPKDEEKKKYGEVFTPLFLIDEILDKLDAYYSSIHDKSIFTNKKLKWLDPANGMGNFMIRVYQRLFDGLKIKDENKRRRHILENMLYTSEINPKNNHIYQRVIMDCEENYKMNIYEGDTLELDIQKEWGIEKFDVVLGNPPYNNTGKIGTGNSMWQKFVKKSIEEWVVDKGYVCFVHPPNWRKPCNEKSQLKYLYNMMVKESYMLYLSIHNVKDGNKTFNCSTRYDWYVLQKNKPIGSTKICDENKKDISMKLFKYNWIPNKNIKEICKLQSSTLNTNILMNSSYHSTRDYVSKEKTKEFKYPLIHSTPKSGIRYMYSNINNKGHFGQSKIIFGESGINDVIIDMKGKYGMTQGAIAILVDNKKQAKDIKKALLSEKFQDILKCCIFSTYRIESNLFKSFKKGFYKDFLND
jgi:16S rRNA G966 N2-methylase RsmD/predicted Zn-ribbon and HTH transcriptional regulator